ncbi:MAG: AI-2E family transporter [Oscillospiraceae bacterium]|nr:AI-2E family transporter [Oscillospiraceae bacterium]
MKIEWNNKYTTISVYAFLTTSACILFFMTMQEFYRIADFVGRMVNLMMPFIIGFIFAYILNPVLNFFEKKIFGRIFGNKISRNAVRNLSVLFTMLFFVFFLILFFALVIPQISQSLMTIYLQAPSALYNLQVFLHDSIREMGIKEEDMLTLTNGSKEIVDAFISNMYEVVSTAAPYLINVTLNITSWVIHFVVGFIVCIYFFFAKEKFMAQIKKVMYALFSKDFVDKAVYLGNNSHQVFSGFISGKILDSCIIGLICYAGLFIIGTPYPLLISIIVGVTNVIPYFGPFIGAIPSALIVLIVDPMECLYFIIFVFILQQFDGNILGPKILGDSTGLSAFWVIFSITIFGGLWGFMGMLVGVPLFSVLYAIFKVFVEIRLENKQMSTDTADYASAEHPLIPAPQKDYSRWRSYPGRKKKQ